MTATTANKILLASRKKTTELYHKTIAYVSGWADWFILFYPDQLQKQISILFYYHPKKPEMDESHFYWLTRPGFIHLSFASYFLSTSNWLCFSVSQIILMIVWTNPKAKPYLLASPWTVAFLLVHKKVMYMYAS